MVIERTASYVTPEQAGEHIAGYLLHNDYSERAFQLERGGQWSKGKSADSFAPPGGVGFAGRLAELTAARTVPGWDSSVTY